MRGPSPPSRTPRLLARTKRVGKPIRAEEEIRRTKVVEDMMLAGSPRSAIASTLNLSPRTIRKYARTVIRAWREAAAATAEEHRDEVRRRILVALAKTEAAGAWGPHSRLLDLLARFHGLVESAKFQVGVQVVNTVAADVEVEGGVDALLDAARADVEAVERARGYATKALPAHDAEEVT